ncbi:MAG: saccharopine dehydrogenase family protein, partial [Planctomycetota bacterium]
MKYIILGAGRQGLAIGYDLLKHGEASRLTLVDVSKDAVMAGAKRLRRMVPSGNVHAIARNVPGKGIVGLLKEYDVCISAVPYHLNPLLAKAALQAKTHFCDLGGNTALVKEALRLRPAARAAGVTIVPDCGLAPGLGNVLAQMLVDEVPGIRDIRIRCGGLPVKKFPPLDYSLLFSIEGLTNEYRGKAAVLRNGGIKQVEAFTECEPFRGPRVLGPLECFFTSGGTTTAPWRLKSKLRSYEYKTVRYKGHFEKVRAMIDLGLLSLEPVNVKGKAVVPR